MALLAVVRQLEGVRLIAREVCDDGRAAIRVASDLLQGERQAKT